MISRTLNTLNELATKAKVSPTGATNTDYEVWGM
jgi:hypothetical protein